MKKFWKTVLAVVTGIILADILGLIFFGSFISALGSSGQSAAIPSDGVMVIDMSKVAVAERAQEDPMALLQGSAAQSVGLWNAIQALHKAEKDPAVKYIYLKADGTSGDMAVLQEFRAALDTFRKSGKAVIAFIETPSTGSYYLASVADKVYMANYAGGSSMMTGISSQLIFLKDLLDKLGVNVQLIRHGKYKSAGEMYIKNQASKENLEQNQVMINSIWSSYSKEICERREIDADVFDRYLNNLELNSPQDFLDRKLVDALYTKEELKAQLAVLAGADDYKSVSFFDFASYASTVKANVKSRGKIAVIYANGEIVDGNSPQEVAGGYFAREIAKVRNDESVKAVVLRVNSPGGSVVASDKIKTELDLLKEVKPLVASYGGYAASGGYWISNNCERIFCDPVTLTGSIGVFSMIPDFSGTLKNIAHVNITAVSSHKHGDMYGMMRPLDAAETAYMQAQVEDIYSRFVAVVSQGRELDPDFVDSIAQGRVWAGTDALEIGLVDEMGGLEDAVRYAASLAGNPDLSAWNIHETPKVPDFLETIQQALAGSVPGNSDVVRGLEMWQKNVEAGKRDFVFARIPYQLVWL